MDFKSYISIIAFDMLITYCNLVEQWFCFLIPHKLSILKFNTYIIYKDFLAVFKHVVLSLEEGASICEFILCKFACQ